MTDRDVEILMRAAWNLAPPWLRATWATFKPVLRDTIIPLLAAWLQAHGLAERGPLVAGAGPKSKFAKALEAARIDVEEGRTDPEA